MAPSVPRRGTQYALVVDAGSSGSRLQIYSWRDPGLERAEIVAEVRQARAAGLADGTGRAEKSNVWWWWDSIKGKVKATAEEMEMRALRRLVRVGKGIEGDEWVKRVEPGISTMAPDDIPAYLAPLLEHALEYIPPSQHRHTPIYVLATAGMRLLPSAIQESILAATCDTLRTSYPFIVDTQSDLGPCGDSVRIISGKEEGIWGWVAVNYLMDGFGHAPELQHIQGQAEHDHLLPLANVAHPAQRSKNDALTPVDVNHHSPTFGFLDMGGASTQLAFSPTKSELEQSRFPHDELAHVRLRLLSGEVVEWPVFAVSWLGFGTNQVRERYVDSILRQHGVGGSNSGPIVDSCLPSGLRMPTPDPAKHPDFVGAGNFSECLTALKPLLQHDKPCPAQHCLFGGLPTPHIDFQRQDQRGFIGISEYWYTANQVLGLGGVWDWAEWERSMSDFCAQDWNEVEEKIKSGDSSSGSEVEISRLKMQCFKGAWISNVLHEGIGIPRLVDAGGNDTLTGGRLGETNAEAERRAKEKGLLGKKPHFQSMDEVNETAISWTLGKIVLEASRAVNPAPGTVGSGLTWDPMSMKLSDLTAVMWGYILLGAAVVFFILSALRRRRPRRRKLNYSFLGLGLPCTEDKDQYGYEEAGGQFPKRPVSKLKIWSRRLALLLRRNVSFGGRTTTSLGSDGRGRHTSLPLSAPKPGDRSWASQPPSPSTGGRLSPPLYPRAFNATESAPSSPPRRSTNGRSSASRTARPNAHPRTMSAQSVATSSGAGGGWNDPPMALFHGGSGGGGGSVGTESDRSDADDGAYDWRGSKLSAAAAGTLGVSGERSLSRQSSRVSLSELGLAQRTLTRSNTTGP